MDATEKPEERAALLEAEDKSQAELFKIAEARWKASVDSARSLLLDSRVRRLRAGCGPKDGVAAQVHAAQKERVEVLTDLVKTDTDLCQAGWPWPMTASPRHGNIVIAQVDAADTSRAKAHADLLTAQVNEADTSEAKVLLLTKAVKAQTEYLRISEVRYQVVRLAKLTLIGIGRVSWISKSGYCKNVVYKSHENNESPPASPVPRQGDHVGREADQRSPGKVRGRNCTCAALGRYRRSNNGRFRRCSATALARPGSAPGFGSL